MGTAAVKTDWDTEEMPREQAEFVLRRHFGEDEIENLKRGNIPKGMEDKWFWYMEGTVLYAHRSWTGNCIFIIRFDFDRDEHVVMVNQNREQCSMTPEEAEILLQKLLDWWVKPEYDYYHEWIEETADGLRKREG